MKKYDFDVVVVGGGPAGMGASISASKAGAKVLLIEREQKLGGILKQCIHSGFGLHHFGEEMTGPEYAYKFILELEDCKNKYGLQVVTETFVLKIDSHLVVIKNQQGIRSITCGSVVLAMGCRERTAGAIGLTGERPNGVWTAGQVQKWVNIYGKLPCLNPIILGSGDIGLIMARRLCFEGAKPQMVLEIQPTTSGLNRNIKQCLQDFDIPLYLNTTIADVIGYPNVTAVEIAKVDENLNIIESTRKKVKCDGVILSVGLIPETDLVSQVKMNKMTNSALVNEYRETSIPSVFMCGNVLHVHDLVDFVTKESLLVGELAAKNARGELAKTKEQPIKTGHGIRYTIPNSYFESEGKLNILFRVTKRFVKSRVLIKNGSGEEVFSKFILSASAGEMQSVDVDKALLKGELTIQMEEK